MIRGVTILILLISSIAPVHAQGTTCDSAASDAISALDEALNLLADGNSEDAASLVAAARVSLANCLPDIDSATATEASGAGPQSSAAPMASNGSGDYVLTPPLINPEGAVAFVRFAHTSVDQGPIDVYFGSSEEPVVSNLSYGEVTEVMLIDAGERLFTVRPAGSGPGGQLLYRLGWNFISNSTWIVTAAGLKENFSFIVEPLSIVRNDYGGRARVRVVNLAAGAPRTTVTTATQTLGDGLGWVGNRDTLLEPGDYALQATTTNGASTTQPVPFTFAANVTYTLMVIGRGTSDQPLTFLPVVTPQEVTRVRFINNRTDVIDVYYRPTNALLAGAVDPQTETDWLTLPAGAVTFIAVASGDGPTGRELAGLPWQLRPGRDMVIEIDANGMRVQDVTLTR